MTGPRCLRGRLPRVLPLLLCTLAFGCENVDLRLDQGEAETVPGNQDAMEPFADAGTVHTFCDGPAIDLREARTSPAPSGSFEAVVDGDERLVATEGGGLFRRAGGEWRPLLGEASGYALQGDTLYRLLTASGVVERFVYPPDGVPSLIDSLSVETHDRDLTVTGGSLFLHSSLYQDNHLLVRRSLTDGRVTGRAVPVDRSYVRLIVSDVEKLLEDGAELTSRGRWMALTPLTKNPVRLLDLAERRLHRLNTTPSEEGRVETIEAHSTRDDGCDSCAMHIEETAERRFHRIHAGTVIGEEAVWIVGHVSPGSRDARLYRFPLPDSDHAGTAVRWDLKGLAAPPKDIGRRGDSLLIASATTLYRLPAPSVPSSSSCGDPGAS